jgi:hypothetical protein
MAVDTATFQNMAVLKVDVRGKIVAVKVAVSHDVRHQPMTPQQQQGCWQQQGSQQQEREL